ncbi:MAG: carbamoyltransferase HypF [Caldilineaceae bacterium]|nr:carbamoyltransferase HypF [Caldilineaceae bacterium]
MSASALQARRIRITGVVQGVGFRPFVYTLAQRHTLGGWVLNNSAGVEIVAVGTQTALDAFLADLPAAAPPLAMLDRVVVETIPLPGSPPPSLVSSDAAPLFRIRHSVAEPGAFVPVSPDVAICDGCLAELFDPADRRYHYPFINCTNCGPRYTIIADIPYDRPLTSMRAFVMCPACQTEYDDPANRRFHAQPNACPLCGPQVDFVPSPATSRADLPAAPLSGGQAIAAARALLAAGGILAVKGLGGYHLACNAADDQAVLELRRRKGRVDKPFALMVRDLQTAAALVTLTPAEALILGGRERPIVLLPKREPAPASAQVAPGNGVLGVMLPYTPLHYLLLAPPDDDLDDLAAPDLPALVMTSGNLAEEPIVADNAEAEAKLAAPADGFLHHNRAILHHCDDSVVRVVQDRLLPIRRARGYAPLPVHLPFALRALLAAGGELKNTFCLTQDAYAFLSPHIGDMENLETLAAFERTVAHYQRLFRVTPQAIVCDLHPGYLSTRWAQEQAAARGLPLIQVQHHQAHIAAAMAEHGLPADAQVIGVSFDGTGYGLDGTIWGGEFFVGGYQRLRRAGRLRPVPLPGGDAAIKRPYRVALAHLWAAGIPWEETLPPVAACPPVERGVLLRQLETGLNSVPTSSMGRLFDAVAALAGVRQAVSYEAQAALELETLAEPTDLPPYAFGLWKPHPLHSADSELQFEVEISSVIAAVAQDVQAGVRPGVIATRFHRALAGLVCAACIRLRAASGIATVALSGGVFQNVTLLAMVTEGLEAQGFTVLTHRQVPPNDGGLALGQAILGHFAAQA